MSVKWVTKQIDSISTPTGQECFLFSSVRFLSWFKPNNYFFCSLGFLLLRPLMITSSFGHGELILGVQKIILKGFRNYQPVVSLIIQEAKKIGFGSSWKQVVYWYIVSKIAKKFWPTVRKNCSSDQEKCLKFDCDSEGHDFSKFLKPLEQFISKVKCQYSFLKCSWRFQIWYIRTIVIQIGKKIGTYVHKKLENM